MFRNLPMAMRLATSVTIGLLVLVFVAAVVTASSDDNNDETGIDRGLGKHIAWHTLLDGLALAKKEGKPLMFIIHKSWCGACKSLKPKFRESQKIADLSENFIMVNAMDDDEPPGDLYKPDGGYIPRLLFFDPEGELLLNIINEEGNPQYKYYYYDEVSILASMEKVAALYSNANDDLNLNDDVASEGNLDKIEL